MLSNYWGWIVVALVVCAAPVLRRMYLRDCEALRQERARAESLRAADSRQVTDEEYKTELASYGLFDYCPKCKAYQGCEGDNECISCGYKA